MNMNKDELMKLSKDELIQLIQGQLAKQPATGAENTVKPSIIIRLLIENSHLYYYIIYFHKSFF